MILNNIRKYILIFIVSCCCGCSTINFSANYYDPPAGYRQEVLLLFEKVQSELKLKNTYQLRILERDKTHGIPAISGTQLILPDAFVKYVYQNYYDARSVIFTCVIAHEVSHTEFNLPVRPVEKHFQVDVAAIKILGGNEHQNAVYFYKTMYVLRNYWYARKGIAGHTFNIGWNVLNAASYALGGPAGFRDWFATDTKQRMKLLVKRYNITDRGPFPRSASPQNQ